MTRQRAQAAGGPADFETVLPAAEQARGVLRGRSAERAPPRPAFPPRLSDDGSLPRPRPRHRLLQLHRRARKFFAPFNLSLILQQVTIIAILGIAQTLIILTAGIDLSVGVIMILSSVVMGRTCVVYGVPLAIAFPLGLLVGFLCGAVNGLIVTLLRLPPFIVTLGTWSIFGALNIFYSRSETIRQQDIEAVAPFLQWTGTIIKPYDLLAEQRRHRHCRG